MVIEEIILKHRRKCPFDADFYLYNLKRNLPKFGIAYNKFIVGTGINSEIRTIDKELSLIHLEETALKTEMVTVCPT